MSLSVEAGRCGTLARCLPISLSPSNPASLERRKARLWALGRRAVFSWVGRCAFKPLHAFSNHLFLIASHCLCWSYRSSPVKRDYENRTDRVLEPWRVYGFPIRLAATSGFVGLGFGKTRSIIFQHFIFKNSQPYSFIPLNSMLIQHTATVHNKRRIRYLTQQIGQSIKLRPAGKH